MQKVWIAFIASLFFVFGHLTNVQRVEAGDPLVDILRQKGILDKEDWIKIEADKEKKAEEIKKRREEEFPVKAGWGKKGFTLETRDKKWKTAIQWRFQGRYTYPERGDPDSFGDFTDLEISIGWLFSICFSRFSPFLQNFDFSPLTPVPELTPV